MSNVLTSPSRRTGLNTTRGKAPSSWLNRIQSWPRRVKIGLTVSVLLVAVSSMLYSVQASAHQPEKLYSYKLSESQVQECARELSRMGVDHKVSETGDNIEVAPDKRMPLLNQLSMAGIPHQVPGQENPPLGETQRNALARRQAELQSTLAGSLRGMQGIEDAQVQLALPEPTAFADDNHPTASVLLNLRNGYELPRSQCDGIARFVAAAVPYLSADDVTIVDQTGKEPRRSTGDDVQAAQFELQEHLDIYLTGKAQRAMDAAYGRGNAIVSLNAQIDFTQYEIRRKDVGEAGASNNIVLSQRSDESYKNKQDDALVLEEGASKIAGKTYNKGVEVVKTNPDESTTFQVNKVPRLERLTCNVVVEAASQKENALNIVKGAIGFNASRGDEINVSVLPIHRENTGLKGLDPLPLPLEQPKPADPTAWWGLFAALGLGVGIWTVGQRRIRLNEPHLANSPTMSTQTHCDLNLRPDGVRQGNSEATATQPRRLEKLEEMARQSPRQTASLLRSFMDTNKMD